MSGNFPAINEKDQVRIIQSIRDLFQGRSLAEGTCTLTASTTTTVVTAPNCGLDSRIFLSPRTANAAAALGTTYISAVTRGAFTVTHANNAQTDRTFDYAIRG